MASARQFQFFFQLTAALGPNFSKTFKTANSTMTLLGDKVTAVNTKGTHPYHCISQDGKGVYGWVNAADVK